jgi:small redox-active disulfide protein 2
MLKEKMFRAGLATREETKKLMGENRMVRIEVLGMGCENCRRLMSNVEAAVRQLGIAVDIKKVEDIAAIMERGVMLLPAIIVDGKLRVSGRVADVPEIKRILTGGT